jgi:hypothetical protein
VRKHAALGRRAHRSAVPGVCSTSTASSPRRPTWSPELHGADISAGLPAERATAVAHCRERHRHRRTERGAWQRVRRAVSRSVRGLASTCCGAALAETALRIDVEQASATRRSCRAHFPHRRPPTLTSLEFAADLGGFPGSPFRPSFLGRNGAQTAARRAKSQGTLQPGRCARGWRSATISALGGHPRAAADGVPRSAVSASAEELRGLRIFIGAGHCVSCTRCRTSRTLRRTTRA